MQRLDKSTYFADPTEITRMIAAGIVEGVARNSGRLVLLRMLVSEAEGVKLMGLIPIAGKTHETPGAITSMASREVYRERLGDEGRWAWAFKANRNLSGACA